MSTAAASALDGRRHPRPDAPKSLRSQLRHGSAGNLAEGRNRCVTTSPCGRPDATRRGDHRRRQRRRMRTASSERLPEGYLTPLIPEEGGGLSQGQQPAALHCAGHAVPAPPMLILDEATSSIDTRTELKIQDAFRAADAGAHQLYRGAPALHHPGSGSLFWSCGTGILLSRETTKSFCVRTGFTPCFTTASLTALKTTDLRFVTGVFLQRRPFFIFLSFPISLQTTELGLQ